MIRHWTVAGSPALEARIDQMILSLRSRLQHAFGPEDYTTVVISGGYGRGEGGVDLRAGFETLHNNLDLIWVAPRAAAVDRIREKLAHEARHFERDYGIALDSFVIDESRLRRLPCLVMLYDMRNGHRPLLGDAGWLERHLPFDAQDILPSDMRNLLINRGTLLLINRWLLARAKSHHLPELRRTLIRHGMKAAIGLGDALLFMRGEYHWSYLEKQRRMAAAVDLPLRLRKIYHTAAEFRFRPDYSLLSDRELTSWNRELLALYASGHQAFEAWRLGRSLDSFVWTDYPEAGLRHSLGAEWGYPGTRLRRLKHFVCNQAWSTRLSLPANLGLRALESASLLALMFPLVAYELPDPAFAAWVTEQLESDGQDLLGDYLRAWGSYLDPALLPRLKAWQQQLARQEAHA